MVNTMSTPKHKHLTYEDRFVIQEFLNLNHSFTSIGNRLSKDRRCIAKEVYKHRVLRPARVKKDPDCFKTSRAPYVCINHVFAAHPELLPISKSTFYRYIDIGLLNVKNIDLARKVRYRVKKEYDYTAVRPKDRAYKLGRFYSDFKDYMEHNPMASIVEIDTVIGTQGGKGGKCFLTMLFRNYNLMLIYVLPYKKSIYVLQVFEILKKLLGTFEFSRLFEVILADNGSEFSDPESIEICAKSGEKLSSMFYCDPNCSWQKGSLEKNHEYIRYVLPKGTSFAGISQDDATLLASHINSIPRLCLNNQSPYEAALGFIGKNNINLLGIQKIDNDDINLTRSLFKR